MATINHMEGMILFSELPLRGIRSISSLIKVGRQDPVMVSASTVTKGYINLSERCFSEDDIQAFKVIVTDPDSGARQSDHEGEGSRARSAGGDEGVSVMRQSHPR